ncbi:fimbria/pilus outer membrane usher protein [Pseudomonas abietaniphila]|uniref:Outer membrane usher protein n=1 Tax=Pseudomonas abietaniphila TaxID=89065 RepID=A0A1G8N984_9PSED|nr:fimbria/pilus outer membrane usher protein [Pseudomonas abietaniphila]SDI76636.1 outer membrane usher protein [Pseudomonas abietaniphila]
MPPFFRRLRQPGKPSRLHCVMIMGSGLSLPLESSAATEPLEFQSSFMRQLGDGQDGALALRSLANEDALAPGRYQVSISVNQQFFDHRDLDFATDNAERLTPCLSRPLLEEMGVKLDALGADEALQETCIDLPQVIPGATIDFEGSRLKLNISIPQIAMRRDAAGYVDPSRWDQGINAAFINYQASAQQSRSDFNGRAQSGDLYLTSGVNVGGWRLRSNHSLRQDSRGARDWNSAYTYAQHDLPGRLGQFTLGQTFTPGDVFRSLPIQGVSLQSDMGMLPDSMQGYAPVIRGVAQTRAKVEILQNGYPIYSTYVSPGPYEIDDLNVAGGSGELEIVVTEADGRIQRFTQPYATLGNLLREGVWRYSASVGRYNDPTGRHNPVFWQGTAAKGLAGGATLYGGLLGNAFYTASNLGVGQSLGAFGALSFDVTRSSTDLDTQGTGKVQGSSYALKYGKSFETRTNLRFAGYRYSTEGYRDFDEAIRQRNQDSRYQGHRRSRLEAAIYQNIGSTSALNLTLSQENYWGTSQERRQFQFGFNTQHHGISYNLYASKSLTDRGYDDRQIGLSISMPLGSNRHGTTATFDLLENDKALSQRASLSGRAMDNRLSYRAGMANSETQDKTASLSVGYQAPFGSVGGGVTHASHYSQASVNASGALLLHGDGLEAGPYIGETAALIEVPGVADVGVLNAGQVRTNERGYAVVPYMRPYRVNRVVLNTDELGPDVEIENGVTHLVPRRGAVVKTTFAAQVVKRLVATFHDSTGSPLPFGALVVDADGQTLGVVGQAGQAVLNVGQGNQRLVVKWGDASAQQCAFEVDAQSLPEQQGYRLQTLTCAPTDAAEPYPSLSGATEHVRPSLLELD